MSSAELPLQAVYERIPETATPAQVREIFDSTAICLAGFEGAWLHDGECDCAKRPGYESTVRQIANAYIKVLAEKRSASLYDRVEAWQKDFLKKHFTGSHGSTSYYGDAASGLAIALQEIDRERYDRTSSQVWSEAQSLAPSETSQSKDAPQSPLDDKTLREVVAAAWVKFIHEWRRTTPEYVAEDVAEFFVRKHRTVARQIAVQAQGEPCDACGLPVPPLEANGTMMKGLWFGNLHPKCAEFGWTIMRHFEPPKASAE